MQPKHVFQFFVLLPLGLGLFFGAAGIGPYRFVTIAHHMVYAALFTTLAWACYGLGSKLMAVLLRPWQPSLIVVLVAGYLVGGFALWWPLRDVLNMGFEPFLSPDSSFGRFWPPPTEGLGRYVMITLQGIAGWVLANWLDFRYRGVPRFGYIPGEAPVARPVPEQPGSVAGDSRTEQAPANQLQPEKTAVAAASRSRLYARLPDELRDADICVLEAEEHYTKVHTERGNSLLLMRFSDAIAEMDHQPGLQVHRSYWVSQNHVAGVVRDGRRVALQMDGGMEIPVSRSYRVLVQSAGFDNADAADA